MTEYGDCVLVMTEEDAASAVPRVTNLIKQTMDALGDGEWLEGPHLRFSKNPGLPYATVGWYGRFEAKP